MNLSWKLTWTSFCMMIFILWKVGFHFLWSLWSQNKVQLLTSVLAELLMIGAIVWITRFPSFSSAIHNSFSCHTVILSYCHTVIQFWLNYLWSVQLFGSLDSPVFLQLSIIVLVVILKLASHVHVSTCLYLVIFFPLCPASLMHKNPQVAKQIGACVL